MDPAIAADLATAGKLIVLALSPTLIGVAVLTAPRWCGVLARAWPRRGPQQPEPIGPPIERLAADLRRLLRLHGELMTSAHLAMRAHRLWAVEAAIRVRAIEAARALDVPYGDADGPGGMQHTELCALLHALSEAGLALPARVGPFTGHGRL